MIEQSEIRGNYRNLWIYFNHSNGVLWIYAADVSDSEAK